MRERERNDAPRPLERRMRERREQGAEVGRNVKHLIQKREEKKKTCVGNKTPWPWNMAAWLFRRG